MTSDGVGDGNRDTHGGVAPGMFFSFGVVLGVGYYRTENLFVPIIGHVVFNGVQVLVRAAEVAA